jgi:glyoxylase-like metal-dependent hydrolase (beta-lactamase superfamily II)
MSTSLGDEIHQISVPIMGVPVASTSVYVLEGRRGPVLIDAGWNDDVAWAALSSGLSDLGWSVADIEGVVITHFHPDHSGLAGRIREASDAWIGMHEADIEFATNMMAADGNDLSEEIEDLRRAGAPEPEVRRYADTGGNADIARLTATPDRLLNDGDLIPVSGRTLQIVWTPGHTPGHVAVRMGGVLFAGDLIVSKTTPFVGGFTFPVEERDALGEYLTSLRQIASQPWTRVLPAHEDPISSVPDRVDEISAHHERRLANLYSVLDDQPCTLWEAASRMDWYRPWLEIDPLGWQLALAETSAHVRHLITRSMVTVTSATTFSRRRQR